MNEHIVSYDLEIKENRRKWTNYILANITIQNTCPKVRLMMDTENWDHSEELTFYYNTKSKTINVVIEIGEGQSLDDIAYCPYCGAKFTFNQKSVKHFVEVTKTKMSEYTCFEEVS